MSESLFQRGYDLTNPDFVEANRAGEVHPDQKAMLGHAAGRLARWAVASTRRQPRPVALVPFLLIFALLALWGSDVLSCTVAAAGGGLVLVGALGVGLYRLYRLRARSVTLKGDLAGQAIRSTSGRLVFEKGDYRIEAGELDLRLPFGGFTALTPGTDYRFYYLADAGDVLSVERLDRSTSGRAQEALTEILAEANGFQTSALASNRRGLLAPGQVRHLLGNLIWPLLFGVVALVVVTRLFLPTLTSESAADLGTGRILIGGIVIVVGLVSLYLSARSLLDILGGRVETATGRVRPEQRTRRDDDGTTTKYYYRLGDQHFSVSRQGFRALVPMATYRVYYAPRSRILVNIEALEAPRDRG